MSDVETNLKNINNRIKMSAEKANRDLKDITLVAVTKEFDTTVIKEAIRLKITDIGETKVQEAIKKQKELGNLSKKVKWHFIGYLQSNKAKDAVKIFDMIHTIDRMKIAKKISNFCIQFKKEIPVLVQVNLSGLTHGIEPENIIDFVNDIRKLDGLQVRGLMTIAPYVTDNEKTRPYFSQLRQLAEACHLTDLSMGMTNDFEVAIQEGATMVRIGTAIFGQRVLMSKRTPLFETHRKLGAHFIEFAGWEMPVQYTSIIGEHNAVRGSAGLFDVSHMGRIDVSGSDALNFVQKLITNDVSQLGKNQVLYTPMCNESGTIVDDLLVYRLDESHFMLVVNSLNKEKDLQWMKKNKEGNVKLKDLSNNLSALALQGPNSKIVLKKLTEYDLSSLKYFWSDEMKIESVRTLVSRTGYTGEDGFEIYVAPRHVESIWNSILGSGAVPVGLGARDTLRLEAGFMLYGNDIDDTVTPLEALSLWAVKFDKDFIGKEKLMEQKKRGVKKKLVGFEMIDRGIPRHGYKIFCNGNEIGNVTSGTYSPTLKKNIGLGYVDVKFKKIGKEIKIQIRNNVCRARIVKIPFYRRSR